MNSNIAVSIQNVSKAFKLPFEKNTTLKGALINFRRRGYHRQQVLKSINFDIKEGEFLGILGRNGSGKSTLLKTISGIYSPDHGRIVINGKLTPFIELGVGFNPELSGRDNVFLNGALLGFSRLEIQEIYDDIVAFAELEKFMDQKLKNYSSGMQVRLAFSIAIRANTDILVLDEVLAVGDEAFQRKCYDYFNELKARGKTVVLVTHDMNAVLNFCTRALVINDGSIMYDGDTDSATEVYRGLNRKSSEISIQKKNERKSKSNKISLKHPHIISINTHDSNDENKILFNAKDPIFITCHVWMPDFIPDTQLFLKFNNPGGVTLSATKVDLSTDTVKKLIESKKVIEVTWKLPGIYNDGSILVSAFLTDVKTKRPYDEHEELYEFGIRGWSTPNILIHPNDKITVQGTTAINK